MSLVELARFRLHIEAELARSRLEAAGLHAVVFDDQSNLMIGWGQTLGVRLMVLDEDAEEARAILRED